MRGIRLTHPPVARSATGCVRLTGSPRTVDAGAPAVHRCKRAAGAAPPTRLSRTSVGAAARAAAHEAPLRQATARCVPAPRPDARFVLPRTLVHAPDPLDKKRGAGGKGRGARVEETRAGGRRPCPATGEYLPTPALTPRSSRSPCAPALSPHALALGPHASALGQHAPALGPHAPALGPCAPALGPRAHALGPRTPALGPCTCRVGTWMCRLGPSTMSVVAPTSLFAPSTTTRGPSTRHLQSSGASAGPATTTLGPFIAPVGPSRCPSRSCTTQHEPSTASPGPPTPSLGSSTMTARPRTRRVAPSTCQLGTSAVPL